ncbi:hypothetical protein BKA67DRAFT_547383 [Truncatella angustata]|uniref:Uncharacterized protein n=1 Tax=Truncatella angustata TaxID=152316 RepID=A0A9P8UYG3_9PEZI|nr:uncharacterized protein BKA67DRAFT_547383 [Truncatella angustata]KAH6660239.1 hypothetical protein BKA67DRAFT_547383 [Truncatella angustata]
MCCLITTVFDSDTVVLYTLATICHCLWFVLRICDPKIPRISYSGSSGSPLAYLTLLLIEALFNC